jgi:SEC-C motif-containing protein
MKSGRNESCPCGSGKKYKKCCLLKDQAAEELELSQSETERLELAVADSSRTASVFQEPNLLPSPTRPAPPPTPAPPPDPRIEVINARWLEFEEATDEGRRELFVKALDEPGLMDGGGSHRPHARRKPATLARNSGATELTP